MRWVFALAATGITAFAAGLGALVVAAVAYANTPYPVSSTSGNIVLLRNGELAAYPPFQFGLEPTFMGVGLLVLVASALLGAVVWRPRQPYAVGSQPSS